MVSQDTAFSFPHLFYTCTAATDALCSTGKLILSLLIDKQFLLNSSLQEAYSGFLRNALLYQKRVRKTVWICPPYSARPYLLKWERDSTSVPEAAICCSWDVGCAAVPRLHCSLAECWCQQEHQITVWFDHQITYFSLPASFFISFRVEGKYSVASFNSLGALNLSFHSGNESWQSCLVVGQKRTERYFPLMHKANK